MLLMLQSCIITRSPMPTLKYPAPVQNADKRLLVFLRGLGGSAKSFEEYGLVQASQARYPNLDVWVPNAHFGYYLKRNFLERLRADVLAPAQAAGYTRIDFAGVSLGGFGSLLLMQCCAQAADDTVALIAPYTGEEETHRSIRRADSLAQWHPDDGIEDYEVDLWRWIGENRSLLHSGRVWLGYGNDDELSGHDLLAEYLPRDRVLVVDGGHSAEVFAGIWQRLLERGALD